MQRYIVIRLYHSVITLFAISIIIFCLARVSGSPLDVLLGEEATQEDVERVGRAWGLDRPLHMQYFTFMGNVFQGNFGDSVKWRGQTARDLVVSRLPATLELALVSLAVSVILAVPIGIISAVKKDTNVDFAGKIIALLGQSLPSFWLAIVFMWIFAVHLRWLPAAGRGGLDHLILPAIALGWFQVAAVMRLTRSSMLDVLDSEYVKLARIKGLPEWMVIGKHCLRNAAIGPLTFFGLILGSFMTGSVVIETVFSWPGVGLLAIDAVRARDFPVIQTVVLFFAIIYVAANLMVDVLYAYLDPRIRYN